MISDTVSLSVATLAARADVCDLCGSGPEPLRTVVNVRHARGGAIAFAACERCAAAMRRVIAAAGASSGAGTAHIHLMTERGATAEPPRPAGARESVVAAAPTPGDLAPDAVGAPVLVHDFLEPFVGSDGKTYVVRAYGQGRTDGTWIGWLTFLGTDGTTVRRTPRETSQSSFEHLAYWASDLQPLYFEGAFQRAT